jgi:hypothetical protein
MSLTPAIDVALELLDDMLNPEVDGHAVSQELRIRAYVARDMLKRAKRRQIALWDVRMEAGYARGE